MFPKCSLLTISILSCALVFGTAGTAGAQHRHGGHGHGGGQGHGGHGGHGFGGHGHFGHGHGGHLHHGFGYGGYYGGLGYGGRYYYSDPYSYSYPYSRYSYYDSGYSPYYYAPASSYTARSSYVAPAQPAARTARIDVQLPDPAAQVWVDGNTTSSRGKSRTFETPDLPSGQKFTYTIRASWEQDGQPVTDERVVEVTAGRASVVDFTRPATERIPPPKK